MKKVALILMVAIMAILPLTSLAEAECGCCGKCTCGNCAECTGCGADAEVSIDGSAEGYYDVTVNVIIQGSVEMAISSNLRIAGSKSTNEPWTNGCFKIATGYVSNHCDYPLDITGKNVVRYQGFLKINMNEVHDGTTLGLTRINQITIVIEAEDVADVIKIVKHRCALYYGISEDEVELTPQNVITATLFVYGDDFNGIRLVGHCFPTSSMDRVPVGFVIFNYNANNETNTIGLYKCDFTGSGYDYLGFAPGTMPSSSRPTTPPVPNINVENSTIVIVENSADVAVNTGIVMENSAGASASVVSSSSASSASSSGSYSSSTSSSSSGSGNSNSGKKGCTVQNNYQFSIFGQMFNVLNAGWQNLQNSIKNGNCPK